MQAVHALVGVILLLIMSLMLMVTNRSDDDEPTDPAFAAVSVLVIMSAILNVMAGFSI